MRNFGMKAPDVGAGSVPRSRYFRWRIFARMRRFFRPTFRRPFPPRVAMRRLLVIGKY